jgi:hypothetical protein
MNTVRISSSWRLRHKSQDDRAVAIGPGDCVEGTLPKPSCVKVAKIFTMHSTLVLKRICVLRQEKLAEVLHELRAFLS